VLRAGAGTSLPAGEAGACHAGTEDSSVGCTPVSLLSTAAHAVRWAEHVVCSDTGP
jgi:hypothetical protein